MQWDKVDQFNKCIAYKGDNGTYIMFGPDLSKFQKFNSLEELLSYAESKGLLIQIK